MVVVLARSRAKIGDAPPDRPYRPAGTPLAWSTWLLAFQEGRPLDWRSCLLNVRVEPNVKLLGAGQETDEYSRPVHALGWERLFGEHGLEDDLERLRISYRAYWSFGERLPMLSEGTAGFCACRPGPDDPDEPPSRPAEKRTCDAPLGGLPWPTAAGSDRVA